MKYKSQILINETKIDNTIAICVLVRDCEKGLLHNIPKIQKIRGYFNESWVIVIENDSCDNSKQIIKEWKEQYDNVFVESTNTGTVTIPKKTSTDLFPGCTLYRIEKMANYRNKYLQYIKCMNLSPDLLLIMDIDIEDFDEEGVIKAIINAPKDWSALFANGRLFFELFGQKILGRYYDSFAYRPSISDKDCTFKELGIWNDNIMWELNTTISGYVPCKSAFGGIGIYKYEYIKDSYYYTEKNSKSNVMEAICEHVSINESSSKFGVNYVVRDMIVSYEKIKGISNIIISVFGNKFFIKFWELIKKKSYYE